MIEAVSTLAFQGGSQRSTSRAAASYQPAQAPAVPETSGGAALRIRFDNFLNLAILEVRSAGDVVQQYPTEQQIRAFQRAADFENKRDAARREAARAEVSAPQQSAPQPQRVETPQPQQVQQAAPQPQQQAPAPVEASAPVSTDSSANSTQSVVV